MCAAAQSKDDLGQVRLGRAFRELAQTLVTNLDVDDFLHLLCEQTADVLTVQAVGVLVEDDDGRLALSSASSRESASLDLFELQAEEGPCFDAYQQGERVVVPDLRDARDRWPRFVELALGLGFRSAFGFPLRLGDECVGAMNLFRHDPGSLDEDQFVVAEAFTNLATVGLLSRRRVLDAEERSEQLRRALASRVLIEQAKGAVAARRDIGPEEAFRLIRDHARSSRTTLREVCEAVMEGDLDL